MIRKPSIFIGLALVAMIHAYADEPTAKVSSFIENRCVDCHDSDTKKGNLDLSSLKPDFANPETFARWVKVHDRVRAGDMPPKKEKQPSAQERDNALKALSGSLSAADTQRQRQYGRVALRRLNRAEYENTIRDLFDLPGLQVREMLPEDGRLDGFDKASAALDISVVQLDKYLEAADFVLDAAIAHQDRPMVWKQHCRRIGGLVRFGECSFPIKNGKADMELLKEMNRKREDGKSMPLPEREPLLQATESLGFFTHARSDWRAEVENFSPFYSGLGENPSVDAAGTLPWGGSFDGPDSFKNLLSKDVDKFAEALASQLATFALRRITTVDDLSDISKFTSNLRSSDYRLRDLIVELVLSDLFRRR